MNVRPLLILSVAVAAILAPATAADAATRTTYPSITKVDPLNLAIGERMTVTGRNFLAGKHRTTVVFKRDGQRAIFAKAVTATTRKLTVLVPEKLRPFLATKDGAALPTKFRIRVLARRFGKRYTALSASPVIAPAAAPQAPADGGSQPGGTATPPPDCDRDGQPDDVDVDDDNDHMSDAFEQAIATDRCKLDTDDDGMSDFWEYESALDLNLRALPYPGKRPYPNPLFADADVDYDGDGMVAWQEHAMWVRYGGMGTVLTYSDGTQTSDPGTPLTDDRRDVDADELPNWWEANGPMRREWWTAAYPDELAYGVTYADPDFLDPDSDGDGRLDGPDDLDHDGFANTDELSRWKPLPDKYDASVAPRPRWVQPHNPCLPDPEAITCSLHPPLPLDMSWPPFKDLGHPVPYDSTDYPRPLPWPAPPPPATP
jgi:hypothetical protein